LSAPMCTVPCLNIFEGIIIIIIIIIIIAFC
jgi:hypothetical protein